MGQCLSREQPQDPPATTQAHAAKQQTVQTGAKAQPAGTTSADDVGPIKLISHREAMAGVYASIPTAPQDSVEGGPAASSPALPLASTSQIELTPSPRSEARPSRANTTESLDAAGPDSSITSKTGKSGRRARFGPEVEKAAEADASSSSPAASRPGDETEGQDLAAPNTQTEEDVAGLSGTDDGQAAKEPCIKPDPRSKSLPANWPRTAEQLAELADIAAGGDGLSPQSSVDENQPESRGTSSSGMRTAKSVGVPAEHQPRRRPMRTRSSVRLMPHPSRFGLEALQHQDDDDEDGDEGQRVSLEQDAATEEPSPESGAPPPPATITPIPRRRPKKSATERSLHQRAVLSAQHQQLLKHASQFGWPGL